MKKITQLVPAFASARLERLALGIGVSAVAIALTSVVLPQPASAQSAGTVQPLQDFTTQQNERDTFTGQIGDNGFNVFNLIHQAQTRGSLDMGEFLSGQTQSLDKATAEFRRQQLLRLNQQQASPANTETIPQQSN
jgi:hypothetical protein